MINQWARRWNIPPQAIAELSHMLGATHNTGTSHPDLTTEAGLQQAVRLEAARRGARVWRNNSGVATDPESGRPVRYGLANDSKQQNTVSKSSDLIGITPVICQCGHLYGIFTAYEVKKPGWRYTGTEREQAQLAFGQLVVSLGGTFKFISRMEDL